MLWCYETEFRSLMAWGKKLLLSLSVFAIMLLKRLPDGSRKKRRLPGWFESLIILAALLLQLLGRCPAERGEQTLRCAPLSAQLSAELCSPDLWGYHTTLRCTELIHFLWPLNRKISELLIDDSFPITNIYTYLHVRLFHLQSISHQNRCQDISPGASFIIYLIHFHVHVIL